MVVRGVRTKPRSGGRRSGARAVDWAPLGASDDDYNSGGGDGGDDGDDGYEYDDDDYGGEGEYGAAGGEYYDEDEDEGEDEGEDRRGEEGQYTSEEDTGGGGGGGSGGGNETSTASPNAAIEAADPEAAEAVRMIHMDLEQLDDEIAGLQESLRRATRQFVE